MEHRNNPDGMSEWEKYILEELRELRREVVAVREQVAGLMVKSGLWGAVAGAIPAIAAILYVLLK